MLSGPAAHKALEDALADLRREEAGLLRRIARGMERASRLRQSELALARGRGAEEAESADETLAVELLGRHGQEAAALETALTALDRGLSALCAERDHRLAELSRRLVELEAVTRGMDTPEEAGAEARRRSAALGEAADRAEEEARHAAAARPGKRRPFEEDALFTYLFERGYGTQDYRAWPPITWLDARLARLVSYDEARAKLALIDALPAWRVRHAERLRAAARAAQERIKAAETEAIDRAGGRPAREGATALARALGDLHARIGAEEERRESLLARYGGLLADKDGDFARAMGLLAALSHQGERGSAGARQDARAEAIADIRQRLGEDEFERAEELSRLRTLAQRRRELEEITHRFRAEGFDLPRAGFSEERLAGEDLDGFLQGAIGMEAYWDMWRAALRRAGAPPPEETPRAPNSAGGLG